MAIAVENNLAIMKEGEQVSDAMERLERKIDKEIAKPFVDIHFFIVNDFSHVAYKLRRNVKKWCSEEPIWWHGVILAVVKCTKLSCLYRAFLQKICINITFGQLIIN